MKNYTIFKNCHYSTFIPKMFKYRDSFSIEKTIVFDDSCKYEINETSCVNKLMGFQFGLLGVHKNSMRFGWIYNKDADSFFIYEYVYENGKLEKKIIFECKSGEKHTYKISYKKNLLGKLEVEFSIDSRTVVEKVINEQNRKFIYSLGFYFGGNSRAPHKMKLFYE